MSEGPVSTTWNKCCEAQPPSRGPYLAWAKPMTKAGECYFDGEGWWSDGYCELSILPTHWSPLPPLPGTVPPKDVVDALCDTSIALGEINKQLREALGFYANPDNYDQFGIVHNDPKDCHCGGMKHRHPDCGRMAREALKR